MPHTSNGKLTEEDLRWYFHFEHKRLKPSKEETERHKKIAKILANGCFGCEYNQELQVGVNDMNQLQWSVRVRVLCTIESLKKGAAAKPAVLRVNPAPTPGECKRLIHMRGPQRNHNKAT